MNSAKIRILQVVGGMNRGGTETWLMHILRHLDASQFQMDFLVHQPGPFDYEPEIRQLGGRVLLCAGTRRPWTYVRNFRRVILEHGPYDIVHSHMQHFSGFVMRLAKQAGVRVRIAHSHLDSSADRTSAGVLRRLYFHWMDRWLEANATLGIAVSKVAAAALFGPSWEGNLQRRLLYCGIDLSVFQQDLSPLASRTSLGIPADAFVIGHAGRMMEQKNHPFLVEIFADVARRNPKAWLLLVGDGPRRGAIERQVRALGVAERVTFAGVRADVPRLMRGAMDVFVLPSLFEGLPLVGMEAQAAGLPMVISDGIAPELDLVPELVHRMSLASPTASWAERIQAVHDHPRAVSPRDALAQVARGPFNIETSARELMAIYQQQVARTRAESHAGMRYQICGV